jgi:uncharacterized protein (TIGR03437 family)
MKSAQVLSLLLLAGFASVGSAQTFDTSGNGLLNGTDYFRQVFYQFDSNGNLARQVALFGNITFDGNGHYTINGSKVDSSTSSTAPQAFTTTGTYSIAASGMGFIGNPFATGDSIYGLVSKGIFIGSSTETAKGYNDLFIAVPVGSTPATNATFNGTYFVSYVDPSVPLDAMFQLSPNGQGALGTVNATGYFQTNTTAVSQTFTGVTYAFSNGAANVSWHGSQTTLLPISAVLYISPDGNFIFGGDSSGFDMFVGVRTTGGAPTNFKGLYYQIGIEDDLVDGFFDSYYGSFNAVSGGASGGGIVLEAQRVSSVGVPAYDYTFNDTYKFNSDGTVDDKFLSQHYVFGVGGAVRIGFGVGPVLGFNVALQAPTFSGRGVYLDPTGVVNAASFAPFTARLSPGEFITLFGTGLATGTASASSLPLPGILNNVQVMINGRSAPLNYVSPTQISAIVPYFTESIAQIQVINNGVSSNTVSELMNQTSPGIFTCGAGYACALHADYSPVSTSSPAQIGETIQVYLNGLGTVTPAVADGAPGSATPPYNTTTNQIVADIDGTTANVSFQGLAPGFAGVYQLNVKIPSGLSAGDRFLDVSGPDSYDSEALISIGTGSAAAAQPATAQLATPAENRRAVRPVNPSRRFRGSILQRDAR